MGLIITVPPRFVNYGCAGSSAALDEEEKTEFDVEPTGFDAARKIKVIKVVR